MSQKMAEPKMFKEFNVYKKKFQFEISWTVGTSKKTFSCFWKKTLTVDLHTILHSITVPTLIILMLCAFDLITIRSGLGYYRVFLTNGGLETVGNPEPWKHTSKLYPWISKS
jgi:hypothetical protein